MAQREDIESRIELLTSLKAQGYRYSQLVKAGMSAWQVSERQVKRYLKRIQAEEQLLANASVLDHLGSTLIQYRYLYAKALQNDDLNLARKIKADEIRALSMLRKLPTQQITEGTQSHETGDSSSVAPDELVALLSALEADELNA